MSELSLSVLTGLITGFVMCIPIGPINVWVIQTVIKKGKLEACTLALGGSAMDTLYFYAILSGLSFLTFSPTLVSSLKILGTLLILGLGVIELMKARTVDAENLDTAKKKANIVGLGGFFLLGVILYTSNPTLIVTMTGLGAFLKSLQLFEFTQPNIISLSLGLGLGSFLWFFFLSLFVQKFEQAIRGKYLKKFTQTSGILMILFALFMGAKLAKEFL